MASSQIKVTFKKHERPTGLSQIGYSYVSSDIKIKKKLMENGV